MWGTAIVSFFAGLAGANGVPHFVKGITKEPYPCALGNSPVPNLIAGWAGLVVAALLLYQANLQQYPLVALASGSLGALLIGLFHAWRGAFGRGPG
jgi:hypothetical protein